MRNVIAFVVALGIVVAIFWFTRESPKRTPSAGSAVASGSSTPAMTTSSTPPSVAPMKIDRVRRLDPAARKALGEQIAAARQAARAKAAAAGQPVVEETMTLEDVGPELKTQLEAALPLLAACYEQRTDKLAALAQMTLLTDPDLGTVIDTEEIKDADGKPLETTLETCLRDAIDSLALPPLGARGGKLPLQYTFKRD